MKLVRDKKTGKMVEYDGDDTDYKVRSKFDKLDEEQTQ